MAGEFCVFQFDQSFSAGKQGNGVSEGQEGKARAKMPLKFVVACDILASSRIGSSGDTVVAVADVVFVCCRGGGSFSSSLASSIGGATTASAADGNGTPFDESSSSSPVWFDDAVVVKNTARLAK